MKRHASKHDRFWKKRGPRRSNGRRPPTHVNDYAERAMMIALWNNSWAPETNAQRRRRIVEENRAMRDGVLHITCGSFWDNEQMTVIKGWNFARVVGKPRLRITGSWRNA